jgi:hypothetical protein
MNGSGSGQVQGRDDGAVVAAADAADRDGQHARVLVD